MNKKYFEDQAAACMIEAGELEAEAIRKAQCAISAIEEGFPEFAMRMLYEAAGDMNCAGINLFNAKHNEQMAAKAK